MTRFLILFFSLFSNLAFAAPKADLWSFWNSSNAQSSTIISHQKWQYFLESYLVRQGEYVLVKYNKVTNEDKNNLKSYLSDLAMTSPTKLNKAEQYAYWVNLYNALTIDLILDNYPLKSITKLGGLFSFGPWDDDIIKIQGKTMSLNDIEHRILRPIWKDPRTHYAVNCASFGCPNLQQQAFTAENSEVLLELAAKEFINSDKGVLVKKGQTELSSIYDWFAVDFGGEEKLIGHFSQYRANLPDSLGKINYEYDWSLNEIKR